MDLNFAEHIPAGFDDASRVWIYQSSRLFFISEALEMEDLFSHFTASWKSHGAPVKGFANLFFGRFIVLMADETAATVGGCSTDSSVHFIQSLEKRYNIQLLDRQQLAFVLKDKVELLPMSQLGYAVENHFITADTLYFNNTVLTKKEMLQNWIIPVKDSWISKRVSFPEKV